MTHRNWQWLLLLLFAAALLRLAWLGQKSLWLDEALSIYLSSRSQAQIWAQAFGARPETHPPLYYSGLHVWMNLVGQSETAVRLPSALFSIINVGLLYGLGRRLFDRQTALLAAGLLAVSPLNIWYAQEARMYVFMVTVALLAALLLTWDSWWTLPPLTAVLTIGLYLDYTWLLQWTFISALWIVAWRRQNSSVRRLVVWAAATAVSLLLFLPGWPHFTAVLAIFNDIHLFELLQSRLGIPILSPAQYLLALPFMALSLAFAAALLGHLLRQPKQRRWLIWLILIGFGLLTLLFPLPRLYGLKRVLVLFWPFAILLAAWLIMQIPARRQWSAGILIGISLLATLITIFIVPKDDWRAAAAYSSTRAEQQDVVWIDPIWNRVPFAYYAPLIESQSGALAVLQDSAAANPPAIWLVAERAPGTPIPASEAEKWLDQNWQIVETIPFYRIELRKYAPRP